MRRVFARVIAILAVAIPVLPWSSSSSNTEVRLLRSTREEILLPKVLWANTSSLIYVTYESVLVCCSSIRSAFEKCCKKYDVLRSRLYISASHNAVRDRSSYFGRDWRHLFCAIGQKSEIQFRIVRRDEGCSTRKC